MPMQNIMNHAGTSFCRIYEAEIKRIDFISEGADYYEREKAGCQEQMEKCCSSVSYVTGGSTGAECEGFTQRTFKTGLYHPMSSEA